MMRAVYMEELKKLNSDVIKMGTLLEDTIQNVLNALLGHDTEMAQKIMKNDDEFDALNREIEFECIRLIAKQAPVAKDLRRIAAVMHIIIDLERIADNCSNISECILHMNGYDKIPFQEEIQEMFHIMNQMTKEAIDSFVSLDEMKAMEVLPKDDMIDAYYETIKEKLASMIQADGKNCRQNIEFIMIIRHVERMADHATNIAEWVYFIISGELIE